MPAQLTPPPVNANIDAGNTTRVSRIWHQWFTSIYATLGNNPINSASSTALKVYFNGSQTVNTATITKVKFDTKLFDNGSLFDNVTNNNIVITNEGIYNIIANVSIASCTPTIYIYYNGVEYSRFTYTANTTQAFLSDTIVTQVGDTIDIRIQQSSGSGKALTTGSNLTYLTATALA